MIGISAKFNFLERAKRIVPRPRASAEPRARSGHNRAGGSMERPFPSSFAEYLNRSAPLIVRPDKHIEIMMEARPRKGRAATSCPGYVQLCGRGGKEPLLLPPPPPSLYLLPPRSRHLHSPSPPPSSPPLLIFRRG